MLNTLVEGMRMSVKQFAGAWGRKHVGLVLGIVAAGFASSGFSEPVSSAAERVILGDAPGIPLAASANPDTIQNLNILHQMATKNGAARVIVGVRAAFAPEGLLSAGNVALQRDEIATVQSAVLDKIASLKQKPEKPKRFEFIPFMAIEADPSELEALANLPEITSIEEDRLAVPSLAESVPVIGGQTAWSSGYTGLGQAVAILDTGVDKAHSFLANKVVSEACYSTNNVQYGATSVCPGGVTATTAAGSAMPYTGACPAGECDHGTHVAGIVAGTGASYSGVAREASLVAIQVFTRIDSTASCGSASPCAMSYTSDQILGLQQVYALRNTYSIASVNMSLGGGRYSNQSTCDSANTSIKAAIDNLRSVNIATVIASGNNGYTNSISAPGCISSAVSVGATWDAAGWTNNCAGNNLGNSSVDKIACYSNSVSFLNLLAPGSKITSSIPGGGYATWDGTSMATPHVAGAWALLKQKKAVLTVTEGLNALISTGVPVTDARNSIVKPRIQIDAALIAIASSCSYSLSATSLSTSAAAATGSVNVTAASGCAWTATSNNTGWITITSGASGSGNGTVGYSVAANTRTSSRTGAMTIAGQTFTVTQAGAGSPAAPTLNSITPSTIMQGTSYQNVTFSGSGFTASNWPMYSVNGGSSWAWATSAPTYNSPTSLTVKVNNKIVQTIYFRVCASYGSTACSGSLAVTVQPSTPAPTVRSLAATSVSRTSAQMNGSVNPNGYPTTAYFEYGTTTSYGSVTGSSTPFSSSVKVSSVLPAQPSTTYHYRIVATNSGGTSRGLDVMFKTLP